MRCRFGRGIDCGVLADVDVGVCVLGSDTPRECRGGRLGRPARAESPLTLLPMCGRMDARASGRCCLSSQYRSLSRSVSVRLPGLPKTKDDMPGILTCWSWGFPRGVVLFE